MRTLYKVILVPIVGLGLTMAANDFDRWLDDKERKYGEPSIEYKGPTNNAKWADIGSVNELATNLQRYLEDHGIEKVSASIRDMEKQILQLTGVEKTSDITPNTTIHFPDLKTYSERKFRDIDREG